MIRRALKDEAARYSPILVFFYNFDEDGKNQKKEEKKMGRNKDGPLGRRRKEGGQLGLAPESLSNENL